MRRCATKQQLPLAEGTCTILTSDLKGNISHGLAGHKHHMYICSSIYIKAWKIIISRPVLYATSTRSHKQTIYTLIEILHPAATSFCLRYLLFCLGTHFADSKPGRSTLSDRVAFAGTIEERPEVEVCSL